MRSMMERVSFFKLDPNKVTEVSQTFVHAA